MHLKHRCSSWTVKIVLELGVHISLSWNFVSPFAVLHDFRRMRTFVIFVLTRGTLSDLARRGVLSHGVAHDRRVPGKLSDIGHSYPMP